MSGKETPVAETSSHKQAKQRAAGDTEVLIRGNRRLDSASKNRATEVERSSDMRRLEQAAERLRDSGRNQKVLQVPQHHMDKAVQAMKNVGITGSVKNMSSTKRRSVTK